MIISIAVFIICPNNLALIAKFQHPPCCPVRPEKHIFANLCQDHDGLVATSRVSSFTFPEPWILTSIPFKLNTFQALPYYSIQVMLPDLAGSGNAGSRENHMLCRSRWKQRHFQTGPGEREREWDWKTMRVENSCLQKKWKSCFGVQLCRWLILPRSFLSYFWGSSCLLALICWTHPQFLKRKFRTKCCVWVYRVTEAPANPFHSHLHCVRVEPGVPDVPCLPYSTSHLAALDNVFSADQRLAMWMSCSGPEENRRAVGLTGEERICGSSWSLPLRGIWMWLSGCR